MHKEKSVWLMVFYTEKFQSRKSIYLLLVTCQIASIFLATFSRGRLSQHSYCPKTAYFSDFFQCTKRKNDKRCKWFFKTRSAFSWARSSGPWEPCKYLYPSSWKRFAKMYTKKQRNTHSITMLIICNLRNI